MLDLKKDQDFFDGDEPGIIRYHKGEFVITGPNNALIAHPDNEDFNPPDHKWPKVCEILQKPSKMNNLITKALNEETGDAFKKELDSQIYKVDGLSLEDKIHHFHCGLATPNLQKVIDVLEMIAMDLKNDQDRFDCLLVLLSILDNISNYKLDVSVSTDFKMRYLMFKTFNSLNGFDITNKDFQSMTLQLAKAAKNASTMYNFTEKMSRLNNQIDLADASEKSCVMYTAYYEVFHFMSKECLGRPENDIKKLSLVVESCVSIKEYLIIAYLYHNKREYFLMNVPHLMAVSDGTNYILRYLGNELKCKMYQRNKDGKTALQIAIEEKALKNIEFLSNEEITPIDIQQNNDIEDSSDEINISCILPGVHSSVTKPIEVRCKYCNRSNLGSRSTQFGKEDLDRLIANKEDDDISQSLTCLECITQAVIKTQKYLCGFKKFS